MATFANLHHVGEVLVALLERGLDPRPNGTVQVGPPLDSPSGAAEDVRVTLLWTTPVRRNEGWSRSGDKLEPPPLSLTGRVLITTYGSAAEDPIRAHELLGQVMRTLHGYTQIELPLEELPNAGEGRLQIELLQSNKDLMEEVFTTLQLRHRPWAVYEVGPIELGSPLAARELPPAVLPGGLQMQGPSALSAPVITSVMPSEQGVGGTLRIEFDARNRALRAVLIDDASVPAGELLELGDGVRVLSLPEWVPPGVRALRLVVGDDVEDPPRQFSARELIEVLPASLPSLDAPRVSSHALGEPLRLSGRALASVVELLVWPDRTLTSPEQLVILTPTSTSASEIVCELAPLLERELGAGRYRACARVEPSIGGRRYTPHIVLELRA